MNIPKLQRLPGRTIGVREREGGYERPACPAGVGGYIRAARDARPENCLKVPHLRARCRLWLSGLIALSNCGIASLSHLFVLFLIEQRSHFHSLICILDHSIKL